MKITASLNETLTQIAKENLGIDIRKSRVRIYKATKTDPNYSFFDRGIAPPFKIREITNKKRLKSILESTTKVDCFEMRNMDPMPDWDYRYMKDPYPYNKVISSCLSIIYFYYHNVTTDSPVSRYVPKYFVTVDGVSHYIFMFD
jgi:hypothetical protein